MRVAHTTSFYRPAVVSLLLILLFSMALAPVAASHQQTKHFIPFTGDQATQCNKDTNLCLGGAAFRRSAGQIHDGSFTIYVRSLELGDVRFSYCLSGDEDSCSGSEVYACGSAGGQINGEAAVFVFVDAHDTDCSLAGNVTPLGCIRLSQGVHGSCDLVGAGKGLNDLLGVPAAQLRPS